MALRALSCTAFLVVVVVVATVLGTSLHSTSVNGRCSRLYEEPFIEVQRWIILINGIVQFLLLLAATAWSAARGAYAKRRINAGLLGNEDEVPLIFPTYTKLLCFCAITQLIQGVLGFIDLPSLSEPNSTSKSFLGALSCASVRIAIDGAVFALFDKGAGIFSIKRTVVIVIIWFGWVMGMKSAQFAYSGETIGYQVEAGWLASLITFYSFIGCTSSKMSRCCRRQPALRWFARVFLPLNLLSMLALLLRWGGEDVGFCFQDFTTLLLLVGSPWVVYLTLVKDSKYWQGLGSHPESLNSSLGHTNIASPLQGISLAPETARQVAMNVGLLHTKVPLLELDELKIDKTASLGTAVLGAGSNSRVFRGAFRGRPCAIKMLFSPSLTPDVVDSFVREAKLLDSLQYAHVVRTLGLCIKPPSLCLVMELCTGGNLYELIRDPDRALSSDWATQLRLAYQCCRAVSFLHSQKPAVLHLDIKSPNFLLDKYDVIKIADLELSRRITQSVVGSGSIIVPDTINWVAPELIQGQEYDEKADVYSLACVLWEIMEGEVPYDSFNNREIEEAFSKIPSDSGKGGGTNPLYHDSYDNSKQEPASSYNPLSSQNPSNTRPSLARQKSAAQQSVELKKKLAQCIIHQTLRPTISPGTHPALAQLVTAGWHSDPTKRPTASEMARGLECLRESVDEDSARLSRFRSSEQRYSSYQRSPFLEES